MDDLFFTLRLQFQGTVRGPYPGARGFEPATVEARLRRLQEVGVAAVWLMMPTGEMVELPKTAGQIQCHLVAHRPPVVEE